jgi:hypothetical protein
MTHERARTRKNKRTFTLKEYNSGDGMLTSTWGPAIWHFLHMISFNYPVAPTAEQKTHYRDFILSLKNILPCKYCRINLRKNLAQMPLTAAALKDRGSFSRYVYDLHELVNRMLKKKSGLTYCDVRERYEHFRSRCTQANADKAKEFTAREVRRQAAQTRKRSKKEHKGCTEPLWGKKSKCVIKIVPQDQRTTTFSVDEKCIKRRVDAPGAKED